MSKDSTQRPQADSNRGLFDPKSDAVTDWPLRLCFVSACVNDTFLSQFFFTGQHSPSSANEKCERCTDALGMGTSHPENSDLSTNHESTQSGNFTKARRHVRVSWLPNTKRAYGMGFNFYIQCQGVLQDHGLRPSNEWRNVVLRCTMSDSDYSFLLYACVAFNLYCNTRKPAGL